MFNTSVPIVPNMPRRASIETESSILQLFFHGNAREKIEQETGASAGLISRVLMDFRKVALEKGFDEACAKYGSQTKSSCFGNLPSS